MTNNFSYQSDEYDRQTQRFVIPLYIQDELGNYNYSSTGTLVKYNSCHYIIFAAHALTNNVNFEKVYTFLINGEFSKISDVAIGGHQIFNNEDIVVVNCFNNAFEKKNYFNLNEKHLRGFEKNFFAWTGFPSSKVKSKIVHNTKSKEALAEKYVHSDESGYYFKNAEYYTIISKLKQNNRIKITGKYNRENASLKYKGKVSIAPHPKGMSGGAIYFFLKGQKLKDNLDDTFRFAGIGIEYNKSDIIGVPRDIIIDLITQFEKENPLTMEIVAAS